MHTLRHGAPHGIVGNAGELYTDNIAPTPNTVASLVPGAQSQKFRGTPLASTYYFNRSIPG